MSEVMRTPLCWTSSTAFVEAGLDAHLLQPGSRARIRWSLLRPDTRFAPTDLWLQGHPASSPADRLHQPLDSMTTKHPTALEHSVTGGAPHGTTPQRPLAACDTRGTICNMMRWLLQRKWRTPFDEHHLRARDGGTGIPSWTSQSSMRSEPLE